MEPEPGFFVPALRADFYTAGKCGTKKGGVNDLGKLRRGAKRNGAILTFLISSGWGAGVFAPLALKICNSRYMRRKKDGIYILGKMRNGAERNRTNLSLSFLLGRSPNRRRRFFWKLFNALVATFFEMLKTA
jgi:hypothetical protein